jgi:hypothetical protein
MKKFHAVNKRNGKDFIVTMMEDKAITREAGTTKEKEVSLATIKRWFELGQEIKAVKKVEKKEKKVAVEKNDRKHSRTDVKKDGTVREDKFKPKLNAEIVSEIKRKLREGAKQSHLAKEYGVSNQTIRCIRLGKMWKEVA